MTNYNIVNGDGMKPEVLEKCIQKFGKDVYSFCIYTTRNKEDADDLYQRTFLVVFEKDEIDFDHNPKSYIITIAANLWRNEWRKSLWRKKKAGIIPFENEDLANLSDDKESTEDMLIRDEEQNRIRKLVGELPEKLRIVTLMYYMEDMSVDEIASALGIPPGTVKSRMHKAKQKLKESIGYEE